MFAVHFFENKNVLLTQFLNHVPAEGEDLTIKGRKGKISSVKRIDEKNIHVQVYFEKVNKNKPIIDYSKKTKR